MTTQPTPTKEIRYDRVNKDYALYLDGKLVGFAANHADGERVLDELAYEQLTHDQVAQADEAAERAADAEEEVSSSSASVLVTEQAITTTVDGASFLVTSYCIESDTVLDEHWLIHNGIPMCIAATREQAETLLAALVADLKQAA